METITLLPNASDKNKYFEHAALSARCFCPSAFLHREQIRKGLQELHDVQPGGDTFMHEGILRVSGPRPTRSGDISSLGPEQAPLGPKHHVVAVLEQEGVLSSTACYTVNPSQLGQQFEETNFHFLSDLRKFFIFFFLNFYLFKASQNK